MVAPIFQNHCNRIRIMRIILNKVIVVGKRADFCKKSCIYYMCKFYKIYLYWLVVILLLYDVIYKQK